MAIEELPGGTMVFTGGDVELFAAVSLQHRLHLEIVLGSSMRAPACSAVKKRYGFKGNREKIYRQFSATMGLDPGCNRQRYPDHDHGPQRSFRIKQGDRWVVVRGENGQAATS